MYGSPLGKDWRVKKVIVEEPLQKFKSTKAVLSSKTAKELVEKSCSPQELLWIEAWLDNLVRSRSLPPQCRGKDAFNALTQFLSPSDVLRFWNNYGKTFFVLTRLRRKCVMTLAFFWRRWGHLPHIKPYLSLLTTTIGNKPMTLHHHKRFVCEKQNRHSCCADPSRRQE